VPALEPARRPSSDEPAHKHISRLRPAPLPSPLRRPHGAGRTPCVDATDEAALATSRAAALRPPPRPGRTPCAPLRLLPACTRSAPVSWSARGVSRTPFRPERAAAKPLVAAERLCAAGPCRPHLRRARARRRGRVSRTRAPSTCRFRGRPGRGARVGSPRLAARDAGAEGARRPAGNHVRDKERRVLGVRKPPRVEGEAPVLAPCTRLDHARDALARLQSSEPPDSPGERDCVAARSILPGIELSSAARAAQFDKGVAFPEPSQLRLTCTFGTRHERVLAWPGLGGRP
jgi:hypothetical protein